MYAQREIDCAICDGSCNAITGLCSNDPCCQVSCDTPPDTGCYESAGLCAQGACSYPTRANGTSCSDGDACNGDEVCLHGSCLAGLPLDCDDGNHCTLDSCDAAAGCQWQDAPDGTGCQDDGQVCTVDTCQSGACAHLPAPDDAPCSAVEACLGVCADGVCSGGADCDDADPCTLDACLEDGCAASVGVPDGTPCLDEDLCNGTELCLGGACLAGVDLFCDDANACTADGCDPALGCVNEAQPDGTACSTADLCEGTCASGLCSGGVPIDCDDQNPCTQDACGSTTNVCSNTPREGAPCDDGDACTVGELCDALGQCSDGQTTSCDDHNPCTQDACDAQSGCANSPAHDGTTCDDGDACTEGTVCAAANCGGGAAPDCDDQDPCTVDSCDAQSGCAHELDEGASCDDGDETTEDDVCDSTGQCSGSPLGADGGSGDGSPRTDGSTADSAIVDVAKHDADATDAAVTDATPSPGPDAGADSTTARDAACGCAAHPGWPGDLASLLVVAALLRLRARRVLKSCRQIANP